MANSANASEQRLPRLGDALIATYSAKHANRARARALADRLAALEAGFTNARKMATERERPGTPIERTTFATVAEVDELRAFLFVQEKELHSSLDKLESWIDYCESVLAALGTWREYTTIAGASAYWLTTVELHKGRLPSTRRRTVRADFGMTNGVNEATEYHWGLGDQFPNVSIDVIASLRTPVMLRSVTQLSTLHLIGSVTRPGLDVLGPKLDLEDAKVWWPQKPTPQDMLVATVAEHVPDSGRAPKGTKSFKSTFEDYINNTDHLLGPYPPPVSLPSGERQVVPSWTPYDMSNLDNVPTLKYFSKEVNSYRFTKNAIDYFYRVELFDASQKYTIPKNWEPLRLMNTIENARKECVESLVDVDKIRTKWFNARDAYLRALKRFFVAGYGPVRDDRMSMAEWLRTWTSDERFRTWISRREAFLEAAKRFEEQTDGQRLHKVATTASQQLADARDDWNKKATRLGSALKAWDEFIRGDMPHWRSLSVGLPLSTRSLNQIFQMPMALFHFKGEKRDVLIRADYLHLYDFQNSLDLSPVLYTNSLREQQIGLCGATGHAVGAHLHVQTRWCDAEPADAAACLKESKPDEFMKRVNSAARTWRPMPPAFLFPKAG